MFFNGLKMYFQPLLTACDPEINAMPSESEEWEENIKVRIEKRTKKENAKHE